MHPLSEWGFSPYFSAQLNAADERAFTVGRVLNEEKGGYRIITQGGVKGAQLSGRFAFRCDSANDFPAVGDWVLAFGDDTLLIERVLERKSVLARRQVGKSSTTGAPQVLAANLDLVFIVTSLNSDLNPRRLERYLALAISGGITPVIVLSKADLISEAVPPSLPESFASVTKVVVSAHTGTGLADLQALLTPGATIALVGSSGVGKSSIVNALSGANIQVVQGIRGHDERGRHTTTSRSLFRLDSGALLIDTPGIREVGMTDDDEGIRQIFVDLDQLAGHCRFSNCSHSNEPGCHILAALASGELDERRVRNWHKLQREQAHQEKMRDKKQAANAKRRFKDISKFQRGLRDKRSR